MHWPRMMAAYHKVRGLVDGCDSQKDLLVSSHLDRIVSLIRGTERAEFFAPDLVFPRYGWDLIDSENGYALKEKLKALRGGEVMLSFSDALNFAALTWRFGGMLPMHNKRLIECAESCTRQQLLDAPTESLFELLMILTDNQALNGMARVAKFTGPRPDLPDQLRPFVGDMLFLSSFHRHKLYGDRQNDEVHVPSLNEAQGLATRYAGQNTINAEIYDALVKSLSGDMQGAEEAHQRALEMPGGLTAQLRGARNVMPRRMINGAIRQAVKGMQPAEPEGANFSMSLRHDGKHDDILFVATESVYFDKFAEVFIASASTKNPNVLIHLHLIDFHLSEEKLQQLEKTYGVRLNTSHDTFVKNQHVRAYGDYIVNARYIYLDRVLPHYRSVFLSDIDGLVHRRLSDYQLAEDPCVLLATRIELDIAKSYNAIWGSVSGGIFGISNTPKERLFATSMAHLMSRRIKQIRKRGGRLFFADQAALAQLYLALRDRLTFRSMKGPFFQQAEDVPGSDRLLNKELWQEAKLKEIMAGRKITGKW